MQLCLGATYSWSVYVQPLTKLTGFLQGPIQLPFTIFYFAFPATAVNRRAAWNSRSAGVEKAGVD